MLFISDDDVAEMLLLSIGEPERQERMPRNES